MAKWEERDRRNEQQRRDESIASLRDRMSRGDSEVRKREAEMTAEQAVRAGITHRG